MFWVRGPFHAELLWKRKVFVYICKCSEDILQTLSSWTLLLSQQSCKKCDLQTDYLQNEVSLSHPLSALSSPTICPSLYFLSLSCCRLQQSPTVITAAWRWVADSFLWRSSPQIPPPPSPRLNPFPPLVLTLVYIWPKMLTACCVTEGPERFSQRVLEAVKVICFTPTH